MRRTPIYWVIALACILPGCSDTDAAFEGTTEVGQVEDGVAGTDEDDVATGPDNQDYGKQAAREAASPQIDFAGRFSSSYTACGTGCVSVWFVDRQTGDVIEAPFGGADDQMIDGMDATADSNVVEVFYGSRDGLSDECDSQRFEWTGVSFNPLSVPQPSPCPER